jgi:hypothetical protein
LEKDYQQIQKRNPAPVKKRAGQRAKISSLRNLGPVSEAWLHAVGIDFRDDLERVGSVEAYMRVVVHGFNPTLNLLYAMEGALRDVHWTTLLREVKQEIKQAVGALDGPNR